MAPYNVPRVTPVVRATLRATVGATLVVARLGDMSLRLAHVSSSCGRPQGSPLPCRRSSVRATHTIHNRPFILHSSFFIGFADFPSARHSSNKFGSALAYSENSSFFILHSYLTLMGVYCDSVSTFLYAGRIMRRPSNVISSMRCAVHPTMRAMAKSGVYISSGSPIIS